MHPALPAFTLRPGHARLINATEGFRLEVRGGCLWLTRPGDAKDHFLVAGAAIDLHDNHVLIQSDQRPGSPHPAPARYVLLPLPAPAVDRRGRLSALCKAVSRRLGAKPLPRRLPVGEQCTQ